MQERQTALKKLEAKISRQAKTVTAIADLDLTRSRIMAKLHRDTDPLKRGTSQLLKMSPTVLKSIRSNLEDKKQPQHESGKSHKPVLPIPPFPKEHGSGHPLGISQEGGGGEVDVEARRKKHVDVDSLVTPRRNVRKWERELVGLVKDRKKREEVASGAKTERRIQAFKPPSKDEIKRLSMKAAVDLGYSSEGEEEEEPLQSKRRMSQRRRRSSTSIVLEEDLKEGEERKDGKASAVEADKGEAHVYTCAYTYIAF